MRTVILSVGGSIVAPDGVDTSYVRSLLDLLTGISNTRFVLVVGGGRPARTYQEAGRQLQATAIDLDWIGIRATYLNAELVRAALGKQAYASIVTDPSKPPKFSQRFLVCSGWKPGWSTDYDAVLLATKFKTNTVVNLSNIDVVYDKDPRTSVAAKQFSALSWKDYLGMIGTKWEPGKNCPFDPIASKLAKSEEHSRRKNVCWNDVRVD